MKTVVFINQGRYGDVIAASMIANMLIEKGYLLYWFTVPAYVKLVEACCPECICFGSEKYVMHEGLWGEATTGQVQQDFPAEQIFNAHFGCSENHDVYIASGKHPLVWLHDKAEEELGVKLPQNYRDYLIWKCPPLEIQTKQPYCIIAPQAQTCGEMTEQVIVSLWQQAEQTWYPKLLVKELGSYKRELCLTGYTFLQCVEIIREASHFIGLDSGLAWASLYSECTKQILHKKERLDMVHTAFGFIDPKAQDMIQ